MKFGFVIYDRFGLWVFRSGLCCFLVFIVGFVIVALNLGIGVGFMRYGSSIFAFRVLFLFGEFIRGRRRLLVVIDFFFVILGFFDLNEVCGGWFISRR